jgi:hypothetical protein
MVKKNDSDTLPEIKKKSSKKTKTKADSSSNSLNSKKNDKLAFESKGDSFEIPPELPKIDENLMMLYSEEERKKLHKNLDHVKEFLEKIGIGEINVDKSKLIISVPFEYEANDYTSYFIISHKWTLIKCSILALDSLDPSKVPSVLFEILKANFILNNVVFSMDPEGKSLWLEADIPIEADIERFQQSYFSIVFGIDYFLKSIVTRLNISPEPKYREPPPRLDGSPSLYI